MLELDQEEFKIKQLLAGITKEQLQKEIESQKQILETRLQALQIIKDNNLKVNADVLNDAEKTQQLIDDITTKGRSELAKVNAQSAKDRIDNIQAVKNAELELLKFNFEQEALRRAELTGTTKFIENLQTVDLELTKQYNAQRLAIIKASAEEERNVIKLTEDEKFAIASGALQQINDLSNLLFDIAIDRNKKGAAEEEKIAKQKFQVNKALQLGLAVIDSYKAITSSLAQSPIAIGPVPNPAGIASLSFAISTSLINIGRILASRYKSATTPASQTTPSVPGPESSGLAPNLQAGQFSAPQFFGLGQERQTSNVGPNQQRVYVVETDIRRVANNVAVIEDRAIVE